MDFSKLTDDQLVELVRSLCFEAAQRGWAVQQAAQAAMLSEAEKARIAADAAVRESERLREAEAKRIAEEAAAKVRREAEAARSQAEAANRRRTEQRRAALAEAVYAVLGKHCTISSWSPRDNSSIDRRIYFDQGDGYARNGWKICVHLDGSSKARPGTVEGAKGAEAEALRAISAIAVEWLSQRLHTKVYVDRDDLERGGEYAVKYQPILADYRAAVAEEERQAEVARLAREAEAERKAREKAAADNAFIERATAELTPLRELIGKHGCTAVRLFPSKLAGNHVDIILEPQRVKLCYRRHEVRVESAQTEHAELAATVGQALKPLHTTLENIARWQPPAFTIAPLEVAHA